MLRGIGFDLRAVEAHRAQLQHAHRIGHYEQLHEEGLQLRQETLAEGRDGVVIGVAIGRDEAEGHRVVRRLLQLATGENARCVAIEQKAQQHRRVVGLLATTAIAALDLAQIQPLDQIDHEPRKVLLGKPILQRRRQQVRRGTVDWPKLV